MNYRKIYDDLILRAENRKLEGYRERHHILPRCMGGSNAKSNIAELTAEEHFVAHQLLVKIYPNHKGLVIALIYLSSKSKNRIHNNKTYAWIKKRLSENMSGDNHYLNRSVSGKEKNQAYMRSSRNPNKLNPRKGVNHHFYGIKNPVIFTKEIREKLSTSKRGSNNPYFGKSDWKHSTCRGLSLEVWKIADKVYEVHFENPSFSYSRISKLLQLDVPHRCASVLKR